MTIRQTRIRNIEYHLASIPAGADFRVACELAEDAPAKMARAGFSAGAQDGDTILPAIRGRVSRFNAEGSWVVRRDQPKEERYIRTVSWKWREYRGRGDYEEMEDFRDIYRMCYPRESVPAPAVEVTLVTVEGRRFIVSPVLTNDAAHHENARHTINLFLELFGECDVVTVGLQAFAPPAQRRVNWVILPPGEHPWDRVGDHIREVVRGIAERSSAVILDRATTISGYGPASVYQGVAGFSDYLAYDFPARGVVILESIRRDNALYVLGEDWIAASQRTKAEIINQNIHQGRIIHTEGWKERLAEVLG
jgi:hypothetical protein